MVPAPVAELLPPSTVLAQDPSFGAETHATVEWLLNMTACLSGATLR